MKVSDRASAAEGEVTISREIPESHLSKTLSFFRHQGHRADLPAVFQEKDFYSHLIRGILQVKRVDRGRLSCLLFVEPAVAVTRSIPNFLSLFFLILHKP